MMCSSLYMYINDMLTHCGLVVVWLCWAWSSLIQVMACRLFRAKPFTWTNDYLLAMGSLTVRERNSEKFKQNLQNGSQFVQAPVCLCLDDDIIKIKMCQLTFYESEFV